MILSGAERMRRHRDRIRPNRGPGPRIGDELRAVCWCTAEIGPVPAQVVRDGSTWACPRPECQEHARAHRRGVS